MDAIRTPARGPALFNSLYRNDFPGIPQPPHGRFVAGQEVGATTHEERIRALPERTPAIRNAFIPKPNVRCTAPDR